MTNKYDVILADAPWKFRVWDRDTGIGRSAESHYPTMTTEDICALPVSALANKNCTSLMHAGVYSE